MASFGFITQNYSYLKRMKCSKCINICSAVEVLRHPNLYLKILPDLNIYVSAKTNLVAGGIHQLLFFFMRSMARVHIRETIVPSTKV